MGKTNQVYDSSSGQPDRDENRDELGQSDGAGRLQDVEILQDVRHGHEPKGTEETEAFSCRIDSKSDRSITHSTESGWATNATRINNADLSMIHTYPCAVQVDGDERGRYREVVDEGVHLQHEPQFIASRNELFFFFWFQKGGNMWVIYRLNLSFACFSSAQTYPYKKVDHKKYIKGQVDLLRHVARPLLALLHTLTLNDILFFVFIKKM